MIHQSFFQVAFAPPPHLGYAENSIKSSLHNDTINGKLCLCVNSPRFHQIVSNKRSKIKISRGSMPLDPPSLPHALHTNTYILVPPPPPITHTISFCLPWSKSWKKPCSLFDVLPSYLWFHWLVAIVFACVAAQTHVPNLYRHFVCACVALWDCQTRLSMWLDWSSAMLTTPG